MSLVSDVAVRPPKALECQEEHCEGLLCEANCTWCRQCMGIIPVAKEQEHKEWHADLCPCNWDEVLAADPKHERGNACHSCHAGRCGYIPTELLPQHLIRWHERPDLAPKEVADAGRST